MNNLMFISGLPRTGSTLLSAILSQNPALHAEGNSAMCQLMWDMQQSCNTYASEQLAANKREQTAIDLVSSIPSVYYKDVGDKVIFDKCRSWTIPDNMAMIKKYITKEPKVIVLERPLTEIVASFVALRQANDYSGDIEAGLLDDFSEPIVRSLNGVNWAKQNNNGEFLFVSYDDLVTSTKATIEKIYEFCKLDAFEHDFSNIVNNHKEDDAVYGMLGQHDIRSTVGKRKLDVVLSEKTIARCMELQ
jgi:sulfotransferase